MNYGLIAEHLGHSFSKIIHGMIDDYDYILKEVPKDSLHEFMTKRDFKGINVTIPYKSEVTAYLDGISSTAGDIGAVNTVVNRDGKLYGYNTDFGGMTALIKKMELNLAGKKVLVLGTGGTSKTARAVSKALGASEIVNVSRSEKEGAVTYEKAYSCHADADIIINTTPCGMFPNIDEMPCDIAKFKNLCGVVDAIFNPLLSKLVVSARERGIKAEGGLYMLVAQAVFAAEIFTGKTYREDTVNRIFKELTLSKKNIVLTGMPGSGKTTVGREIAKRLGRKLIDLDELIVSKSGRQISDIFEKDGEEFFRNLETAAVKEIAKTTGAVISTGGGAVLRRENVNFLRMNGTLIFLNRPYAELIPTDDRPLANSGEKIRKLYEQRFPVYSASADEKLDVSGDIEDTVCKIINIFNESGAVL